ncbi:Nucleoside:proton symporter OS=Leadbetterella byssophila (strain DSM 17132 / KACC 11308 / 4M15) GN=Lbys_1016 PE=4 SV=1: Nuc_H_symport [Gemmataceae bacterium]|nr:Nucleoside:proton symporter OS=Leadbetterella byssophila (strain DSM 17132 / KACC 11308 / 4M15) GN=Lbys_1016 PE=4 SV=1: Nuc_H_symport [Gemmataceae bacterium]VTT97399.1 Nucleoside:proton symporter OS=Leadbetterella byssophila (strain DSM 17132 / KACC 11308 / 4M15) GN=Lbys_1016 PE=4 SV=1: Nuc_H_symport [Gemmataceae bacterium]
MAADAASSSKPPLAMPLRLSLSLMMFLQFAIWGSWFVVFFPYLRNLNFTGEQAGALIGNMALGAIFSTIFAGYIADRLLSSERLMAICHLLGAGLLYAVAQLQNPGEYWTLFAVTLVYALVYNPTLVLANSITFEHVPDGQRDFPGVRVLGTVGWIAAGFAIDAFFAGNGKSAAASNGPLLMAAGLSALLGVYSLFLPHTPPKGAAGGVPFVKALGLFKDFSFAVFFIVSLVITVVLAFYYTVTSDFLASQCGVKDIGRTMSIGQVCETVFLPLLPLFLVRMGMKWVLAMGMLCWGLRYLCFAYAGPEGGAFALAIVGIALHGLCFDFFFAAGFIHCDNKAPKDIRASAQALFSFLTYGVGMWLGSLICGMMVDRYTDPVTKAVDWRNFWIVPAAGVLACLVVFVLFFRDRPSDAPPEA